MSFDPRDLDDTGLLREILFELQQIRVLLEEQAPAPAEASPSPPPAPAEPPVRTWRVGSYAAPDSFAILPQVDSIVKAYAKADHFGQIEYVYVGRQMAGAVEVEPGL